MIPIDIYDLYRAKLEYIKRHKHVLNVVEGKTSYINLTSMDTISDMVEKAVEEVKTTVAFYKEPFEPATLDNFTQQHYDTNSQLQVFTHQTAETAFDARNVFDADKMSDCIADIYRAFTLINFALPKKIPIPVALQNVERVIADIVNGIYELIFGKVDASRETMFMPSDSALPKSITFCKLASQKYFNDEELKAIEHREQVKREAIAKAEAEAKREEIASRYRFISDIIGSNLTDNQLIEGGPAIDDWCKLVRVAHGEKFTEDSPSVSTVFNNISKYTEIPVVINMDNGGFTYTLKALAYANAILSRLGMTKYSGKEISLKIDTTVIGADQSDFENEEPLFENTMISLYVES